MAQPTYIVDCLAAPKCELAKFAEELHEVISQYQEMKEFIEEIKKLIKTD